MSALFTKIALYVATDEKSRNFIIGAVVGIFILFFFFIAILGSVLASAAVVLDDTYYYPVPGYTYISSGFDPDRKHPITGKIEPHLALDFPAPEGTPIIASRSGVVALVGSSKEPGNFITLQHDDGTYTFYCHCSKIVAITRSEVLAGDVIALVGQTGSATGPHLHFEVRTPEGNIDPTELLQVFE
ncbi:M23 family metallopeptidase [Pygmaiobacter massiliensis]|uniref:M23 family metallopeptidase n=1 Tax=Pygmaiobacter massiliensis TaxID=1917873 RepID=UPI002A822F1A|nr:M23 family metallopeptidase [Pygmaiobacter massiliensis]MDY4785553.1 M23 family metallopeptidase [Pygmaiobacter massiliensis]